MVALAAAVLALAPTGWKPDVRAAEHYAAGRRGSISFAVRSGHHVWGRRMDRLAPSASTLKLILLVAELRRWGGDRPLTRAEHRLLAPMIRASANDPASELVERLGRRRIEHVARLGGMRRFHLGSPWGLSTVSARDLTRFALHVHALVPRRARLLRGLARARERSAAPSLTRVLHVGCVRRGKGWDRRN